MLRDLAQLDHVGVASAIGIAIRRAARYIRGTGELVRVPAQTKQSNLTLRDR
jgi:hypothetical protein